MYKHIPLFLFLIILAFNPVSALADLCSMPAFDNAYKDASIVFEGVAHEAGPKDKCGPHHARFQITKLYKGDLKDNVLINVEDGCLSDGFPFKNDTSYLILADRKAFGYMTDVCQGSGLLEQVPEKNKFF